MPRSVSSFTAMLPPAPEPMTIASNLPVDAVHGQLLLLCSGGVLRGRSTMLRHVPGTRPRRVASATLRDEAAQHRLLAPDHSGGEIEVARPFVLASRDQAPRRSKR